MFDSALPSEPDLGDSTLRAIRADSQVRASFAASERGTHLAQLFERGGFRLRFPRAPGIEAVLINTGGGIAGGDRLEIDLALADGAGITVTTQAAEKLYRSDGAAAGIAVRARLAAGASLAWLPQESILFDGANVERSLDIELAASSSLTAVEALVLGRIAHGEQITSGRWRDHWRIRREGKLVLAESVRMDGAMTAQMQRAAIGAGARCLATLVHVAPDAEHRLQPLRDALAGATSCWACSAWNGMLVARFTARELSKLHFDLRNAITVLTGRPMPRAWAQ